MAEIAENLEKLRVTARRDEKLRSELIATRGHKNALKEFCDIASAQGCLMSPMELLTYGEESYAAMKRSTNGGGENSPLLECLDRMFVLLCGRLPIPFDRDCFIPCNAGAIPAA